MKKILVLLPVLLILSSTQLLGQVSQTAVAFLLIAPGARAGGMGETFVAIADDATATHWNPAGLGRYPLSPAWIDMPVDKNQNIQDIALVENNLPENNYSKYDVWAVIDGQLAKWEKGAWKTGIVYKLENNRTIYSLLYRITGLDEEEAKPYYLKLAENYNGISLEEINGIENDVLKQTPVGYQYSNEIKNGFEKVKTAWNDFKLVKSGFDNIKNTIERYQTDGELNTTELDSLAFSFDQAISESSITSITIPFGIMLDSNINCLESNGGKLYLGGDNGFYRYDPEADRWKLFGIEDSLPSTKITALAKFRRKSVLVGTDKGILYFDGAKFKLFEQSENPPTELITEIAAISDYNIWAASENDLYHFDGKAWGNYYEHDVSIGETLNSIAKSFYGLIISSNTESFISELKTFNQLENEVAVGDKIKLPYKLVLKGKVTALAGMGDLIWIGTQKGIILSTGSAFTYFGYKEYVADHDIALKKLAELYIDSGDENKINALAQMIKQYNTIEGDTIRTGQTVLIYSNILGAPIYSIAAASSKKAYVGTAYGVVEYNGGSWSRFSKLELAQTPAKVIKSESGEIWFATDHDVYIRAKAQKQLTFMHSNYLVQLADDLYYDFFSFIYPTSEWGTFGLGITFLSYGSQQRTDEIGNDLGQFNSYDIAITLSYGTKLSENVAAGISAKYINSHLADVGAGQEKGKGVGFSFAVDGGILYDATDRLTLASTVTNIGPEIAYIDADQADPLPTKLSLAAAYKIFNSPFNRLTAVFEASKLLVDLNDDFKTEVNEVIPHIGLEYWYSNYVSLRGGYIYDDIGQQKYFTTGASLQYNNLRFDFSYVPSSDEEYNRMGNTMRFSMNVEF